MNKIIQLPEPQSGNEESNQPRLERLENEVGYLKQLLEDHYRYFYDWCARHDTEIKNLHKGYNPHALKGYLDYDYNEEDD